MKRKCLVVAYDIKDTRRRNRTCEILSSFGERVNYSVFECFLTPVEIKQVKKSIRETVKAREDIVLYYPLCRDCLAKKQRLGGHPPAKKMVEVV